MIVKEWNGSAWIDVADLPDPGINPIADESVSQIDERVLYDGSQGRVVPPVNAVPMITNITYLREDSTIALKYRLKAYERNQTGLMITLPNGERIEGFVKNVKMDYILGTENHKYHITHNLKLFDVDGNGYIGDEEI